MILGEVKARPKDIISFSLDYISKSKVQTSNPSSSPISLDTPARPADLPCAAPVPGNLHFIICIAFDRMKSAGKGKCDKQKVVPVSDERSLKRTNEPNQVFGWRVQTKCLKAS